MSKVTLSVKSIDATGVSATMTSIVQSWVEDAA
jgi:hypothetical protein